MNKFDVIDYLSRFKLLDMQIERRHKEVLKWKDLSLKIGPEYSLIPSRGEPGDRVLSAVCNIAELQEEILREIEGLVKIRRNIAEVIAFLPDDTQRVLLECRYIDGKTFDDIAAAMCYSLRWVMKLHEKAVSFLADNLEYAEEDPAREDKTRKDNASMDNVHLDIEIHDGHVV